MLRPYLSAATRQAWQNKNPLHLTVEESLEYAKRHSNSTVSGKIEKLLQRIALAVGRPGGTPCELEFDLDYPLVDAVDGSEMQVYINHLEREELIIQPIANMSKYAPRIKGWLAAEPRRIAGGTPGRCFVAMSFDAELDAAYFGGIKAAIEDCLHIPVRMKEFLHNEEITARLLAEIRAAEYTVADFTGHKNGVYYEAAFARGLGRQVIMTCRDTDFERLHFDTSHLRHVKWSQPEDLRRALGEHIRATILPPA